MSRGRGADTEHMDEERRLLEQRAFGRDTAEGDRGVALGRLHDLDEAQREAELRDAEALEAEADAAVEPRRRRRVVLIVGAVVAIGVAAVLSVALRPADDSIHVFDHSQGAQDLADAALLEAPYATSRTVRALDQGDNWLAFGLRGTSKQVCLGVFSAGALSMTCTSPEAFAAHGLTISAGYSNTAQELVTGRFSWGPRGPLRVSITSG